MGLWSDLGKLATALESGELNSENIVNYPGVSANDIADLQRYESEQNSPAATAAAVASSSNGSSNWRWSELAELNTAIQNGQLTSDSIANYDGVTETDIATIRAYEYIRDAPLGNGVTALNSPTLLNNVRELGSRDDFKSVDFLLNDFGMNPRIIDDAANSGYEFPEYEGMKFANSVIPGALEVRANAHAHGDYEVVRQGYVSTNPKYEGMFISTDRYGESQHPIYEGEPSYPGQSVYSKWRGSMFPGYDANTRTIHNSAEVYSGSDWWAERADGSWEFRARVEATNVSNEVTATESLTNEAERETESEVGAHKQFGESLTKILENNPGITLQDIPYHIAAREWFGANFGSGNFGNTTGGGNLLTSLSFGSAPGFYKPKGVEVYAEYFRRTKEYREQNPSDTREIIPGLWGEVLRDFGHTEPSYFGSKR